MHNAADPEYIIADIMPAHEIHLTGGPSGAGKTSLTINMMCDLQDGKPVFGKQTYPVPMCYVACDRSMAATERTLSRLRVTRDIPMLSLIGQPGSNYTIDYVVQAALRKVPDLRYLVIDAIAALVPDGKVNDYRKVQEFLARCTDICQKKGITINAQGHSTKVKEGEDFKNPRQRFLGSVAWGGFSETMFYIEPADPSNPADPTRTILVLPRNSASLVLPYTFNEDGKLIPLEDAETQMVLDVHLLNIAPGTEIATALIVDWGVECKITRRTVERWIVDSINKGRLEKVKKGVYRRPRPA